MSHDACLNIARLLLVHHCNVASLSDIAKPYDIKLESSPGDLRFGGLQISIAF